MTVLDAAKALAADMPQDEGHDICYYCGGWPERHESDCPWLMLPQIVTALEAAARIVCESPKFHHMMGGGQYRRCRYCSYRVFDADGSGAYVGRRPHDEDCPWQTLVAALTDEGEA